MVADLLQATRLSFLQETLGFPSSPHEEFGFTEVFIDISIIAKGMPF
jgi:hypothetical protein